MNEISAPQKEVVLQGPGNVGVRVTPSSPSQTVGVAHQEWKTVADNGQASATRNRNSNGNGNGISGANAEQVISEAMGSVTAPQKVVVPGAENPPHVVNSGSPRAPPSATQAQAQRRPTASSEDMATSDKAHIDQAMDAILQPSKTVVPGAAPTHTDHMAGKALVAHTGEGARKGPGAHRAVPEWNTGKGDKVQLGAEDRAASKGDFARGGAPGAPVVTPSVDTPPGMCCCQANAGPKPFDVTPSGDCPCATAQPRPESCGCYQGTWEPEPVVKKKGE